MAIQFCVPYQQGMTATFALSPHQNLELSVFKILAILLGLLGLFLVAQMVKNPPAMRETWIQSLGQEDLLEKGMAGTHSSILAWRTPCTKEPSGLVHGVAQSQT